VGLLTGVLLKNVWMTPYEVLGGGNVKTFFETGSVRTPAVGELRDTVMVSSGPAGARIAVYDSLAAAPRVEDVDGADLAETIERVASRTYNIARERGGGVPYTIIREVAENLIHAGFSEVVVTILDDGNTVRFSDQGPGIADKERAFLPGFSTATTDMKEYIKGVGSGLPIVRECLGFAGGSVEIEDNLGRGTVVTLHVEPRPKTDGGVDPERSKAPTLRLSDRQKQVLSLVMELGHAGPSVVARELSVGLSTAYRDLASLEDVGLIVADESGKRALTSEGVAFLDAILR
jgi:DNA-binding transcriptional ArsR family regulator